jgi:aspartate 1-decarboxylase
MPVSRFMVRSKIHRATITAADLHYIGSITIDAVLLEAADILPYEKVQVVDVSNGNRFETYVIEGEAGSGAVQVNGAAAHLVSVGDTVIIMAYAQVEEPIPAGWKPRVVLVGHENVIGEVRALPQGGMAGNMAGDHNGRDISSALEDLIPYSNVKLPD